MVKIGVLGLQGAVREHVKSVEASGAEAVVVKRIEQLEEIDGLILRAVKVQQCAVLLISMLSWNHFVHLQSLVNQCLVHVQG